jgi:hypothetical protein
MSYGFDQSFLQLNDLRMFLATVGASPEKEPLVSSLMDDPNINTVKTGPHTIFKAKPNIVKEAQAFEARCRALNVLKDAHGRDTSLSGRYAGASCVIVGCGEGFDRDFVDKAADAGAVIIALGNAVHSYKRPHFWVGSRRAPAYVNDGFISPAVTAIYPEEFKNDKLWLNTSRHRKWSHVPLANCPNTLFYPLREATAKAAVEDFIATPSISALGIPCTLTIGITFAASLGFRNIVLHGVSFSEKYCFDTEVHAQTAVRKFHTYGNFQDNVLPKLWTALADRYVNLWATDDCPLSVLRMPSNDDLLKSLEYAQTFNSAVNSISEISTPVEEKLEAIEKANRLRASTLTPSVIADRVDDLLEAWPKRLKGKEAVETAKTRLNNELAKKGSCTGCSKNKLFIPVLQTFAEAAEKAEGKARSPINLLWKKVFPEHLHIHQSGKRIYHPAFPQEDRV